MLVLLLLLLFNGKKITKLEFLTDSRRTLTKFILNVPIWSECRCGGVWTLSSLITRLYCIPATHQSDTRSNHVYSAPFAGKSDVALRCGFAVSCLGPIWRPQIWQNLMFKKVIIINVSILSGTVAGIAGPLCR